jgi:hypothetical protein
MERHWVYYKGEGGGFPQVRAVLSLVSLNLPMVRPRTKSAWAMHYPTYCLVCAGPCEWLKCLSIFLVPSRNSNMPLYPEMLRAKKHTLTSYSSIVIILYSHLNLLRRWECVTWCCPMPQNFVEICTKYGLNNTISNTYVRNTYNLKNTARQRGWMVTDKLWWTDIYGWTSVDKSP